MASVTLKSLENLKTLNKETLYVLLRFYLKVDNKIPERYKPVLLGHHKYVYAHNPKGFLENLRDIIFGAFISASPKRSKHLFMVEKPKGGFLLLQSTREALKAYIIKYFPLPRAVYMTHKEYFSSDEYQRQHGKWDGFI